jgi:tetratricopeptide (TPR) repeat protein
VSFILAGVFQYDYDSHINYFAEKNIFVTLPKGKTLEILSFGFKNFVADMIFIWSMQFYSNYNLKNRFEYIEDIYNIITDLNPRYRAPYYVGSWIMALELNNYEMAIRLLQKASKIFKDDWDFDFESGYYAYKYLKDYKLAEKYYRKAAEKPDAPSFVKRWQAHTIYMEDNLIYALKMWLEIKENAKNKLEKNSALNHLYQIKLEIDKKDLEEKIKLFEQKFRRKPVNLNELKRKGIINMIPKDFKGEDYIYDFKTGKIKAKKVFQWKKFY